MNNNNSNNKDQARRIHEAFDRNPDVTMFREAPKPTALSPAARTLLADGYVILHDVLTAAELSAVRAAFEHEVSNEPHLGRNRFEGRGTARVYSLIAKSRAFDRLCELPAVLQLCDVVLQPNYLITASQCIRIDPGEARQARSQCRCFHVCMCA